MSMSPSSALPESLVAALPASPFALAFSGGLDSRFLAHAAALCGASFRLYHIRGPHVPDAESLDALAWAKDRRMDLTVLELDPLGIPEVRENGRERCYGCKRRLFESLRERAAEDGLATLCDGSNASDQHAYRPGSRALRELDVRSPLADAGLAKQDIRTVGAATGMDRPDQQARPCLLTRYAYGLAPDLRSLAALSRAEALVGALLQQAYGLGRLAALPDFRLRLVAAAPANALPFAAELHLSAPVPDAFAAALAGAVEREGFARPPIIVLKSLSGHYDAASS